MMDGTDAARVEDKPNNLFSMNTEESTNDQLMKILLEKDDISWQQIIYELVRSEQMDPWDIDVSILTQKYIRMLKTLKEHDFGISG